MRPGTVNINMEGNSMTVFVEQVSNTAGATDRNASTGPCAVASEHSTAPLAFMPRQRRMALLARVVQSEILPRLAHTRAATSATESASATTKDDTQALVGILLTQPAANAIAFVKVLRERGAIPASLFLGILTDAARQLGVLWEDDRCSFSDVTIGVCHLQQVVRDLSPSFQLAAVGRPHADTVLLLPAPGEQHSLGLVMLSEFFRREGWHVVGGPASSGNDAVRLVRSAWVDVAGFSIGSDHLLGGLAACITALRKASRNKDINVMVGGPMLLRYPDLVKRTGADTAATDAPGAVREARALLSFRAAAD